MARSKRGLSMILAVFASMVLPAPSKGEQPHSAERPYGKEKPTVKTMEIHPRYARLYTDGDAPLGERNYKYATLDWTVRMDRCAVVAVDCWNWHFSEETMARIDRITRERIGPLFRACREAGLVIVHTPADPVASRHPNFLRVRPDDLEAQAAFPDSPQWPPKDFRQKSGAFSKFARPHEPQQAERVRHRKTERRFHDVAQPASDEPVILDGEDLHRWCAEHDILHLFYVGFNTNACVMMRDYGLPAMARRGYHTILLRDCTTGMEIAETLEDMACTRGTIADVEQFLGYTMAAADLIEALKRSRPAHESTNGGRSDQIEK